MNTLVTGGGGFLGRYIVEQLLARGDAVTVLARGNYPELIELGATLVRGDITDAATTLQACADQDAVFHVAARPGIWGTWESFYNPNVLGTQNVIAACQEQGVPKLIFTSSPSVIFDGRDHTGDDESLDYPFFYENYYSHTKAMAERLVRQANSLELLTVALRPHLIFGPRDTQLLPRLISRAKAGRLVQVGDGANKVDLTYVEDAARAHLLACDALAPEAAVAGSVYFISQNEPVVLWPWINDLLTELRLSPVQRTIPVKLARAVGGAMEFGYTVLRVQSEPRLTRFLASALATNHYYDISAAQRDFGYQPQFDMAQATTRTVAYLRTVI